MTCKCVLFFPVHIGNHVPVFDSTKSAPWSLTYRHVTRKKEKKKKSSRSLPLSAEAIPACPTREYRVDNSVALAT